MSLNGWTGTAMPTRETDEIAGSEGVVTRKGFLRYGLLATAAAFAGSRLFGQTPAPSGTPGAPGASPVVPDRPPPIEDELVKQFVIAGHGNLDKVKEMLAARPALINATWDWGGGDFETALGGASHMGRPDIARYLLENNARMDLFAAAMLGRLDIIKAAAAAFPNIVRVPGPHKIPLIAHAEKGGADAVAVVEFLRTLAS
ncbi:MAG TPA: hypothetical protein VGW39_07970 [Chthoniobacterales bacterium]|nr:hypothetical protein [Chthoniobacterales bacterium]